MSVICYESEKFYRIAETLKRYKDNTIDYNIPSQAFAHIFNYPEGWKTVEGMEYIIKCFCNDLYRANQITYKRQYAENHEDARFLLESLDFQSAEARIKGYTKIELYKALQSIDYNIYDNNGEITNIQDCREKLRKVIEYVAYDIIKAIEEYQGADVW